MVSFIMEELLQNCYNSDIWIQPALCSSQLWTQLWSAFWSLKTGAVQGHHQTYGCRAMSEWPHALHLVHSHVMLWQIQLLACLLVPLPTDKRNLFSAFGFPHASLTDSANFEIVKTKAYLIQVSPAYWTAVYDDFSSEDYMYGIYFASDTFPTATSSSKNS